jgi:peptidylprolyl isomerase
MLTAAKSAGFDRQADTQSQLDALRDVMLVRLWLASKAAVPSGYPSEADISAAYDSNRQALAAPTQYHLAQIYIKAPDGADPAKLLVALKKVSEISAKLTPADFSRMAQDFSEHTESATKGGDLGYLQENRMIPQIAAAVRTMKSGDVVGPIKTPEGLHFLKLLDKKDGAVPALADVHDELASALRSRRASELEQAYIKDQTTESSITINQIALANLQQTLK